MIAGRPGLVGFGYTLVGGMDVDGNGSPGILMIPLTCEALLPLDISAGSLSNDISVIRTSPLINVDISFLEENSSVDVVQSLCSVEGEMHSW